MSVLSAAFSFLGSGSVTKLFIAGLLGVVICNFFLLKASAQKLECVRTENARLQEENAQNLANIEFLEAERSRLDAALLEREKTLQNLAAVQNSLRRQIKELLEHDKQSADWAAVPVPAGIDSLLRNKAVHHP